MPEDSQLSEYVVSAIREGRRIEALKRLRNEKGLGLKDAKELVDREIALHHADNPHYQIKPVKIPLSVVIVVVGVLTVLGCYWITLPRDAENIPAPNTESTSFLRL